MGAGKGKTRRVKSQQTINLSVEHNMYPGGASRSGFLASGEKLQEIIQKDEETLSRLGVTPEEIITRLERTD